MNDVIIVDGEIYKRVEKEKVTWCPAKYKVGDWVKVIANKTDVPEKNNYIGEVAMITHVFYRGTHTRDGNRTLFSYSIGRFYIVYEDELEPAEEPKQYPFNIMPCEQYYSICSNGSVDSYANNSDFMDKRLFAIANACKDYSLMKQRALHETLNRLLWRASIIAGELDNEWNMNNNHYYIYYEVDSGTSRIGYNNGNHIQGICYFPTEESAEDAIENIVKPFMREHPDFVW